MKELPSDPVELRKLLVKLKDKEVRLEADLAIREHPELEEGIMMIVLSLSDAKKIAQGLKLVERPAEKIQTQVVSLQTQIKFYQNKLLSLQENLARLVGGTSDNFVKLSEDYIAKQKILREHVNAWETKFMEFGVNLLELIPTLSEHLPARVSVEELNNPTA